MAHLVSHHFDYGTCETQDFRIGREIKVLGRLALGFFCVAECLSRLYDSRGADNQAEEWQWRAQSIHDRKRGQFL